MLLLRTLSELFMLRRLLQLLVLQWQILLQAPPVQAIINDNRSGPFGPAPFFILSDRSADAFLSQHELAQQVGRDDGHGQ